jgi:hypothetical protein
MKVSELIIIEVGVSSSFGAVNLELTARVRSYPELTKTKRIPVDSNLDAVNDAATDLRRSIAKSVFEIQKLTA